MKKYNKQYYVTYEDIMKTQFVSKATAERLIKSFPMEYTAKIPMTNSRVPGKTITGVREDYYHSYIGPKLDPDYNDDEPEKVSSTLKYFNNSPKKLAQAVNDLCEENYFLKEQIKRLSNHNKHD